MLYAAAIFAPLIGCLIAGLLGRAIGDRAASLATITGMVVAAICGVVSWVQLVFAGGEPSTILLASWFDVGGFSAPWALRDDPLAATMVAMVTTVSTLIHIYSIGYMEEEPDRTRYRFFSYLSLFTFAMLMLVTADNLVQLFFGWEGVGFASYLLIGYWYTRPAANAAAIKAFVVNRVGDLFFAVGIALVFLQFGSVEFGTIFATLPQYDGAQYHLFGTDFRAYEVIGVLLFLGAMGKSAQIGLHVWLPDAMEGPTPVSALIHAATMVTAGVFLMARMSPLLDHAPFALGFVCFIGATTAFFAATVGCAQFDIKRVIAYSTCSQLGYMFAAAGVGAYQVSIFHLICHAFFKALLFLSAGSVIHAMSGEQDMRRMGGIWNKIPITYTMMWVGSLALSGIFPFAGYFSKDAIIEATYTAGSAVGYYAFVLTVAAAFLTAFYSWRLIILAFHGKPRAAPDVLHHVHESPAVMTVPLMALAVGALIAGFALDQLFIGADFNAYWRGSIVALHGGNPAEPLEHVPFLVRIAPTFFGLGGIVVAYVCYMFAPWIPEMLVRRFPAAYAFFVNKWYFDDLYQLVFVRPAFWLGRFGWHVIDQGIIDGLPNGAAAIAAGGSRQAVKLQTGSIAVYAFTMLIGVVVLVSVFLLFG